MKGFPMAIRPTGLGIAILGIILGLPTRSEAGHLSFSSVVATITLSENGTTETYTGITNGNPYELDDEVFADATLYAGRTVEVGAESGAIASGYGHPSSAPGQASAQLQATAQIVPDLGDSLGAPVLVQILAGPGQLEPSNFGDGYVNGQVGPLSGSGAFLAHIGDTIDFDFSSSASTPDGLVHSYWGTVFQVTLSAVPEPSSLVLSGIGVVGVLAYLGRRQRSSCA